MTEPTKHAGGRPTKYTPELLEECHRYLKDFNTLPSIAGLAVRLDVNRDTLQTWAKDEDKPEFSDIYGKLMAMQEDELIRNGLMGHFNASITKMILTKHGYSDKVDATSSDGSMTPTSQPVVIRLVGPDDE
jgi:hypothetical protein